MLQVKIKKISVSQLKPVVWMIEKGARGNAKSYCCILGDISIIFIIWTREIRRLEGHCKACYKKSHSCQIILLPMDQKILNFLWTVFLVTCSFLYINFVAVETVRSSLTRNLSLIVGYCIHVNFFSYTFPRHFLEGIIM